jgi:hypothetical protein
MAQPDFRVQVVGVNVVVTLPRYRYAVTYYKPEGLNRPAYEAQRGRRRLTTSNDRCRIFGRGLEACQRQSARVGLDRLGRRRAPISQR